MEVIKKGKGWHKQLTCKGCEAVLKITAEDLQYTLTKEATVSQQYEDEIIGTFFVLCAECNQNLPIKTKDIPDKLKENLMNV